MQYRKLGTTGLEVSVICGGTWSIATRDAFWDGQQRGDSIAAVHAAIEAGVNFFDTAPLYGNGESEEILGEALAGRRGELIVATKVSPADLEPARLRARCEQSLRALRTDYIDLYQIHFPNFAIPLEATYRTMDDLRREGKVRWLGVSNFGPGYLDEALALGPVASNQVPYSLLWRPIEHAILPRCVARQVAVLAYSPLALGLLTGKFAAPEEVPDKRARTRLFSQARPMTRHHEPGCEQETFAALAGIRQVAEELGLSMAHLAMAWLLAQPGVTAAVAGARNAAQAIENAAAAAVRLEPDVIRRLSAITEPVKQKLGANADPWEHASRMERPAG
ncbi:MAG: aldo/keto reductase [Thermoguttaceae bacterium]|jgi:aryl-alcohol dehydrogenase-like predicted oxidoreductase